ncbi:uncharacterized protein EHS24_006999 [Apiotrichum porosum]|uniref:Translin-associated protein X n=1 Tax=Apiotrichum porosum TaxID=105984 RepID=A0A427XX04_9TREE|nr:uncharacterized protein EHS24_006999 [Apiotrichum porosum]RSH83321.1 hypothetical protein EHS24_006999 [Apiotrichum porosum]
MADVAMEEAVPAPIAPTMTRREHLAKTFEAYRSELDEANERREQIIIRSRAITQLSKKLIFHCHRGATAPPAARAKNLKDGRDKEREIHANFVAIRAQLAIGADDGGNENFWQFKDRITGGLEEYIEAYTFLYYLETKELAPLAELQKALSDESGAPDYILGMSDLTGELMPLSTGDHDVPLAVCSFVRDVKLIFDAIPPKMVPKLDRKQEETTRSLEKIEKVCYALRLRLVEFGDKPEVLKTMAKRALEEANMAGPEGRE